MNTSEQRVALITAVDAVTGISCYDRRPAAPKPGDAWFLVDSIDLLHGLVWTTTWRLYVFLPQDPRVQSEWIDAHFLNLVAALRGPGFADTSESITVTAEGPNDQYVLEITARSE